MYRKTARIEDRSTQDVILDAAATYAGSFFVMSDSEFGEQFLHELHNPG